MRGKAYEVVVATGEGRITPAYAGKRRATPLNRFQQWDHPRLCGEKASAVQSYVQSQGSPPPMRGKGRHCRQLYRRAGITPAYAGKSSTRLLYVALLKDHPRLCGEKVACYLAAVLQRGSPPPMRGKAPFRFVVVACGGITPAYAGKRHQRAACFCGA